MLLMWPSFVHFLCKNFKKKNVLKNKSLALGKTEPMHRYFILKRTKWCHDLNTCTRVID